MARVFNTCFIKDQNLDLIFELYTTRMGMKAAEVSSPDLEQGGIIRGMAELRLYHLPPYYKVDTSIKSRLQSSNSLLVDADDPQNSVALERELMYDNSPMFAGIRPARKVISGMTYDELQDTLTESYVLWKAKREVKLRSQYLLDSQLLPHLTINAEDVHLFNTLHQEDYHPFILEGDNLTQIKLSIREQFSRIDLRDMADSWTSPKKVLLAQEVGCSHCGQKHIQETDTFWTETLDGWEDGLCPECAQQQSRINSWSTLVIKKPGPRYTQRALPRAFYTECQVCSTTHNDYAIWGMCTECYANWQDSYLDVTKLWALATKHGALATLLVRPAIEWVNHCRQHLPTYVKQARMWTGELKELTLENTLRTVAEPKPPKVDNRRTPKVRTLAEAGIDVESVLLGLRAQDMRTKAQAMLKAAEVIETRLREEA